MISSIAFVEIEEAVDVEHEDLFFLFFPTRMT